MDLILLLGIASALLVILVCILLFTRKTSESKNESAGPSRRINHVVDSDIPRRAQIARNQRRNAPQPVASQEGEEDSDGGEPNREKMGAKKRAKLEAKAEKRQQREAEMIAREEKKKRDELAAAERKKAEEAEQIAEKKREELERSEQEEKARKEHEEYLKMKASFQIEEEGFDECDEDEEEALLNTFISFIQLHKVVILESLANQFKLKTQAVIDRITHLQNDGILSGVIDDQGKFIYISTKELHDVSKFIRQRGRVSLTELVESSNNLINLKPMLDDAATVA
ncbi:DDRGK domain-containing protein 1 [Sitodiplosis mosellana]|uniref:DDRGK domain-containing protein 1 n=1 Tax=Sitodiplosis mosellana TaxID=263140 RepID=UPI0024441D35|nr:DDRGK domain-containing protein 1 [Sitodiplosis mosellana]